MIHEVARPCRFGLTSKRFVDFGSLVTNPKVSLSGVAVQMVFAACWEEQDDWMEEERRKFCSGMPSLLCCRLTGPAKGDTRAPRHSSLAGPPKEMTYMHLPPCTRGATLRGRRFEGSHTPHLCNLPRRLCRGWLPLHVSLQAAVLINWVSK